MKELKSYIRVFAVAAAWCLCVSAGAVTGPADSLGVDIPALKARTDSLMRQYRFSEAVDVFLRAKDNADSTLRAEIDAMMARHRTERAWQVSAAVLSWWPGRGFR